MEDLELGLWALRQMVHGVPGPTATAAQVPWPRGPLWSGAGVVCTASSAATGVSEAVGLAAAVSRPGLQVLTPLFPRFHLFYAFQSTHLPPYRGVEFSSILLCRAEASLLSCGCFTGCRMKGREKGSFALCHVADITPNLIFICTGKTKHLCD